MDLSRINAPQYIEIDGVDGVGKTTQCMLLKNFLDCSGISAEVVKEVNGYDDFSENIRQVLLGGGLSRKVEMFLFLALKAHCFSEKTEKYLIENRWIVSDRGMPSFLTYNYDIINPILTSDLINTIYAKRAPDLSIILELSSDELLRRLKMKNEKSRFDLDIDRLYTQQSLLLDMAKKKDKWKIVDGSGSREEVHDRIKKSILDSI